MYSHDLFLNNRIERLIELAAHHAIPAMHTLCEFVADRTGLTEAYRQIGLYTGRILKGAKPADLPVVQSTKFEFVINLPSGKRRPPDERFRAGHLS